MRAHVVAPAPEGPGKPSETLCGGFCVVGRVEVVANFGRHTHTYYAEMLDHPPPGVKFRSIPAEWGHPARGGAAGSFAFWKARGLWHRAGGVNVDLYPQDLLGTGPVLSAQSILLNRVPWALDVDVVSALTGFRPRALGQAANRSFVRRAIANDRCKALFYWSERARRGMEAYVNDSSVAAKGTVVHPAIDVARLPPRPSRGEDVTFLFVGKAFDVKGGPEAVEVAREVLARHPKGVRFEFVTRLPPGFAAPDDPRIRFRSGLSDAELHEAFASADAFFFPTLYEVFGVAAVEAQAHGLPIITLDDYAMPEVVTHGVDGFLVEGYRAKWFEPGGMPIREFAEMRALHGADERRRVVGDLVKAVDTLVRDEGLRRRMGEAARRNVTEGRFSVAAQHRALGEVLARFA